MSDCITISQLLCCAHYVATQQVDTTVGGAAGYRCSGAFINWFQQYKCDIVCTAAVDSQGAALFQPVHSQIPDSVLPV